MRTQLSITEKKRRLIKRSSADGIAIPITVDEDMVCYWWDLINSTLFDDVLQPPARIVIKNFRSDAVGWCIPFRFNNKKNRRVKIGINSKIRNLSDFLSVLIHEMVHQWEWQVLGEWDNNVAHGKDFYSWKPKIYSKFGVQLCKNHYLDRVAQIK